MLFYNCFFQYMEKVEIYMHTINEQSLTIARWLRASNTASWVSGFVKKKFKRFFLCCITHKQMWMHWCILNTVAADALVLKQQTISIHSAEKILIVLDQFQGITFIVNNIRKYKIIFWEKNDYCLRVKLWSHFY